MMGRMLCFLVLLTSSLSTVLKAAENSADLNVGMPMPLPSFEREALDDDSTMTKLENQADRNAGMSSALLSPEPEPVDDDGNIPNEFLMQISASCDDNCHTDVQTLISANNLTEGCTIGETGIDIGSVHFVSFMCDIEELRDLPAYRLKAFSKEIAITAVPALAKAGTRPMAIENSFTVSIPVSSNDLPIPIDPPFSGCAFNSSRGFPFRGGTLVPRKPITSPPVSCDLFGIDETDGGFPRDGLRTCASLSMNGRDVSIWVLDTGCEPSSQGQCLDYSTGSEIVGSCADTVGHGTRVSDIATGANGVATEGTRHCLRVLDGGTGSWANVLRALGFVSSNLNLTPRGNVINLSLSGPITTGLNRDLAEDILNELATLGVFVTAAAGNDGENACSRIPAFFRNERFFSAQAHDSDGVPFEDNNISEPEQDCVDISAPGVDLFSSLPSGTSFATAHVSGAIAVLLSDEREVSLNALTSISRLIENGPGNIDEPSLGLSCPVSMEMSKAY